MTFEKYTGASLTHDKQAPLARFGATALTYQGRIFILGGVIKDEMLGKSNEICFFDNNHTVASAVSPVDSESCTPRPLLIGLSAIIMDGNLLIMGGSAVCFSFGTFWNKGCYTVRLKHPEGTRFDSPVKSTDSSSIIWKWLHTVDAAIQARQPTDLQAIGSVDRISVSIPRIRVRSAAEFDQILHAAKPVIIEGLDIGPCTAKWTASYLKRHVSAEREVRYTSWKLVRRLTVAGHCSPGFCGAHEFQIEEFQICYEKFHGIHRRG
jgi:tRNA wybutosine-synthesizing protein 4